MSTISVKVFVNRGKLGSEMPTHTFNMHTVPLIDEWIEIDSVYYQVKDRTWSMKKGGMNIVPIQTCILTVV